MHHVGRQDSGITDKGWHRTFTDPIPLPGGGELRTLRDAGNYIAKLPKRARHAGSRRPKLDHAAIDLPDRSRGKLSTIAQCLKTAGKRPQVALCERGIASTDA